MSWAEGNTERKPRPWRRLSLGGKHLGPGPSQDSRPQASALYPYSVLPPRWFPRRAHGMIHSLAHFEEQKGSHPVCQSSLHGVPATLGL